MERAMRPIALNRRNCPFADHGDGAATWAGLTSLIENESFHSIVDAGDPKYEKRPTTIAIVVGTGPQCRPARPDHRGGELEATP
jgi:hypothetical protein